MDTKAFSTKTERREKDNPGLKDVKIIRDIIIATIVRNNKIIIPSGDDKIQLGDRVIIITKGNKLVDINDIVAGGII